MRINLVLLASFLLSAAGAQSAVTVIAREVGSDVVFTATGTLNLDAWGLRVPSPGAGLIVPADGVVLVGAEDVAVDVLIGADNFSGPSSFGSGTLSLATSGSSSVVGLVFDASNNLPAPLDPSLGGGGLNELLVVPFSYTSGAPISESSTYENATYSSLGLTEGTYQWTWGSGSTADSFTLIIPEPATSGLLVGGLGLLAVRRRRT